MRKFTMAIYILILCKVPLSSTAQNDCKEPNSLVSITNMVTGKTELLVFTFTNPASVEMESAAAKPPFENYGGVKVKVKGSKFIEIKFHTLNPGCFPKKKTAFTSLVRDIKETEFFEGYATYVVGLNKGVRLEKNHIENGNKYRKFIFRFRKS